jgi:hypothetical protein
VAQLEVPPRDSRRRHHLCPLDAHPEATACRRGAFLDRRLAGGRPHGGRSSLRRGRGRRQDQAGGRCSSAGGPGGGAGACTAETAAPISRQRDRRGASGCRGCSGCHGSSGAGGQTRANLRGVTPATPPASSRVRDPRRRARAARRSRSTGRARPRRGDSNCHSGQQPWPDRRAPEAQANLSRDIERFEVLDHLARELGGGRGPAGDSNLARTPEPAQVQVFQPIHQIGGLVAELLDHLDEA